MKRLIGLFLILVLSFSLITACTDDGTDTSSGTSSEASRVTGKTVDVEIKNDLVYYANIEINNYGTIVVQLDQWQAPITVENFVELAESGFYDGLTFHRIMNGFMMQGGDPEANGTGGSDENIKGEFTANGVSNNLKHTRGAISMARSQNNDSASSQFFIVQKTSAHLDGSYAAFGYVTEGMDIVDKICASAKPTDNNGTIKASQQPVINKITITTKDITEVSTTVSSESSEVSEEETSEEIKITIDQALTYYADIEIANYGTISIELYDDIAPITVDNFVNLAQSGFYDGLTFHRIIEGFMMQGGDPKGNGTGGSDKTIVGEFTANGYNNNIAHKKGVISMARSAKYNSASSQFFIMHDDAPHLDGQYAAFGMVISGIEVVDAVCSDAKPIDNNGSIAKENQPVITKITIRTEE